MAGLRNGHSPELSNLLVQVAYLLTLLDAEVIVADDFPVTQPASYGIGDER